MHAPTPHFIICTAHASFLVPPHNQPHPSPPLPTPPHPPTARPHPSTPPTLPYPTLHPHPTIPFTHDSQCARLNCCLLCFTHPPRSPPPPTPPPPSPRRRRLGLCHSAHWTGSCQKRPAGWSEAAHRRHMVLGGGEGGKGVSESHQQRMPGIASRWVCIAVGATQPASEDCCCKSAVAVLTSPPPTHTHGVSVSIAASHA